MDRVGAQSQKIVFMEKKAAEVITHIAAKNQNEEIVRMTLNRAVKVVNTSVSVLGNNTDSVRIDLERFLEDEFKLALTYAEKEWNPRSTYTNSDQNLNSLRFASAGLKVAKRVQELSQGSVSLSGEAVLLIWAVKFLGDDVQGDYTNRPSFQPGQYLLSYIIDIQQSEYKARILNAIKSGYEPKSSDVAALRSDTSKMITTAEGVYGEHGLAFQYKQEHQRP